MTDAMMRLNFVQPGLDPAATSARYQAGIAMAAWADEHSFSWITFEEHHGVPNGWSPSPLITAGAVLARTTRVVVSIRALLLPLHDPVRIAEDIAVLDLLSGGRLEVVGGIGHRPEEYAAHGKDFASRGQLMDECVDTLLKAWTGEPFECRGATVRVTPVPLSHPVPFLLGGSSKVAARRAARFRLPMFFALHAPELAAYYLEQCRDHGWTGRVVMPEAGFCHQFIVDDPDKAWAELGHHLLHEATTYASFHSPTRKSVVHSKATGVAELRAQGPYRFLTPDEAVDEANAGGDGYSFNLHPLCGGLPIDAAWEMLGLYSDKVLPRLTSSSSLSADA